MPLKAINPESKYSCTFSTLGPVKEEWAPDILEWVRLYWVKVVSEPGMPRLKFETSNTGYPHFHLGMMFVDRQKYRMFIKELQKYMRRYKDDKPTNYKKEKDFSFRMFAVPVVETHNAKVLRGAALIHHYLDNPTKEKSTEGGNFEVEIEGFNAVAFIRDKQVIAQAFYDAAICCEHMTKRHDVAYGEMLLKMNSDKMEYLKKYQASKLALPPITKLILENRPNIHSLAESISKKCPKIHA